MTTFISANWWSWPKTVWQVAPAVEPNVPTEQVGVLLTTVALLATQACRYRRMQAVSAGGMAE
jgi:hypothetical protein